MNFTSEEILQIKELVAGMLLTGNLVFEQSHGDRSRVQNRKILAAVSNLLKIDVETLDGALTKRKVNAKGDSVQVYLNIEEAKQAKMSFVKVMFSKNIYELYPKI